MNLRGILGAVVGVVALQGFAVQGLARASDAPPAGMPKPRNISYYYDAYDQSIARPVSRAFDPALLVRKISGNHREAANVDENDQVRLPSTWWQPRLGFRPVSVEQMLRGLGPVDRPAPGKLLVVRLKTKGATPGFQVKDSKGVKFGIKFDPPQYPELAIAADAVGCYLFWAAGYNVAQNSIISFRREDLEIAPNATYEDDAGKKHPLTPALIDQVLAKTRQQADSSYRASASPWLPGTPLGEWEFRGRRGDDPEDKIPHQLRREIRGLQVIGAWTNDTDRSARNTFDSWVTEGGRSFVRHYLIDFNGTLGAASVEPQAYRCGCEYVLDYGVAATALVTLGLKPPRWESVVDPGLPSVGFIESQVFDPAHWLTLIPNPAFDECTERDMRWGARIVAAFTDEHIRAAVALGKYSDPRASEYLTRILIERRDKIVRRWLGTERGRD